MEPVRMASDFKLPRIGRRPIQSTAGAVTVRGEKGEIIVEKVPVKRYVAGKRPDYAPSESSDEESEDENQNDIEPDSPEQIRVEDIENEDDHLERVREDHGHRIHEPEVISMEEESKEDFGHRRREAVEESSEDEELDEDEIESRREALRRRAQYKAREEKDILDVEEEMEEEDEEEESSEYEEYSDSDDETGLRLKPVFVRRDDRVTIQEREKILQENEVSEEKAKKLADERKKTAARMINDIVREELKEVQGVETEEQIVITDEENDEEEYEAWKVRELKRIKRDRDEKEAREKERLEIDRIHSMTEEERRNEFRNNPKMVTNKSSKGKYKFLQKYYHRGAFFLADEDDRLKKDFSAPTLEDHFDKSILPKVMQVKNFGRSGRTKYTHLTDQDTTEKTDSPWFMESSQSLKFHASHGGGMKQSFSRPSAKRK
ncbi:microfibrillar-associated protein 1-like [Rhopilema esculentum]|uniref:microfibrillar-associated protein 1-like n=1 Tax=Rhopilema esculentum TaxID=499914 RepID=UPI0031E35123|eukprot:gene12870-3618_t